MTAMPVWIAGASPRAAVKSKRLKKHAVRRMQRFLLMPDLLADPGANGEPIPSKILGKRAVVVYEVGA